MLCEGCEQVLYYPQHANTFYDLVFFFFNLVSNYLLHTGHVHIISEALMQSMTRALLSTALNIAATSLSCS